MRKQALVIVGRLPPGPRAEQLTRLARVAEAATSSLVERARALLALTRADGASECMVQAMPVLLGLAIWDLARVAGDHADLWDATQRTQIPRYAAASRSRREAERCASLESDASTSSPTRSAAFTREGRGAIGWSPRGVTAG